MDVEFPVGSDAEYKYEGKEFEFTLKNLDKLKERLPDVEVLYLNGSNIQTDAGTYYVAAIVSCKGYKSVVVEGSFTILKAKFDTNIYNSFEDLTVPYTGEVHKIELSNPNYPEGTTVTYRNNEATEHGVYFATVELSAENYETKTLSAVLKIIDIKKLVSFKGYNAEEKAVVLVYNGEDQSVELDVTQLKALSEFIINAETKETKVKDVVYTGNSFKYPGTYDVIAKVIVEGFGEADVSVKVIVKPGDIQKVYGITFSNKTYEYNGEQKSITVNQGNLTENKIKSTIKYYRVKDEGEELIEASEVCLPGNYRAVIELIDPTGHCLNNSEENGNLISYDFTITKRDVSDKFAVIDPSTNDDGVNNKFTAHTGANDKKYTYILDGENNIVVIDSQLGYALTYVPGEYVGSNYYVGIGNNEFARLYNFVMKFDASALPSTMFDSDNKIVVRFTYGEAYIDVTFTLVTEEKVKPKDETTEEPKVDETTGEPIVDENAEETEKEYVYYILSKYEINGVEYTQKHDYKDVVFVIPIGFVNQGQHHMDILVLGSACDSDSNLSIEKMIDYANLSDSSIKNIASTQKVTANGTLQLPSVGNLTDGITYEMFDSKGNPINGYKYVGTYTVRIVFTKGNYQTTKTVTLKIGYNYWIAAIGVIIGILAGVGTGLIIALYLRKKEKESDDHFRAPGTIVANVRGGIICESYAKFENNGCQGRLYLTATSLEFYSDDYKELANNFLIDIDDIRNVDAIADNKICVYADKKEFIFVVPDGSSRDWAASIVRA